jgi:putative membrane protein
MMYGYWGNMGGFWPFGLIGPVISIVFWVAIVFLLISFFRGSRWHDRRGWGREDDKTPLEILKERYARGEITKREFEDMKKDVEK